jgi:excisionase family DNA binding protein
VSPTNAGRVLDMKPRMVYRLMDSGELPSVRVGRLRFIRAVDLRVFVDRLTPESG